MGQIAVRELQAAIDARQQEQVPKQLAIRLLAPDLIIRESSVSATLEVTTQQRC